MKELKDRILKMESIDWRKLEWLQNPGLKELTKASFQKLKTSLVKNNFIQSFNVWENGKKIWILDGHHRKRAMEELGKEGYSIPRMLPANFINCKNRKEAVKLILVYSAIYANVTEEGLYEFITVEKLNFDDLKTEIDLPKINLDKFMEGYAPENSERESDENVETKNECPRCGHRW
jgi:ParB-like chromosome segregation protein Spo0J